MPFRRPNVVALLIALAALGGCDAAGSDDRTPPSVTFESPVAAAELSGVVAIRVHATDDVGVTQVRLFVGDEQVGDFTEPPFEMDWDTAEGPNGSITLAAHALDAAGNLAFSTAEVTVDNEDTEAPAVVLLAPRDGEQFTGMIELAAEASDNVNVHVVKFVIEGAPAISATGRHPWVASFDAENRLRNGSHTVYAKALDAAFNWGFSDSVTIETWHPSTVSFINRPTSSEFIDLRIHGTGQEHYLAPGDTLVHVEPPEVTSLTYTYSYPGPWGGPVTQTIELYGQRTVKDWDL